MRKIDAMYHYYGQGVGRCEDCPHFVKKLFDKAYYKCRVYGNSNSEATDWRKGYTACGLIDKPFPEGDRRIVETIVSDAWQEKPIDGQMTMEDMLNAKKDL